MYINRRFTSLGNFKIKLHLVLRRFLLLQYNQKGFEPKWIQKEWKLKVFDFLSGKGNRKKKKVEVKVEPKKEKPWERNGSWCAWNVQQSGFSSFSSQRICVMRSHQ